ncbi:hypothetical protein [Niallia sp. 03133]
MMDISFAQSEVDSFLLTQTTKIPIKLNILNSTMSEKLTSVVTR